MNNKITFSKTNDIKESKEIILSYNELFFSDEDAFDLLNLTNECVKEEQAWLSKYNDKTQGISIGDLLSNLLHSFTTSNSMMIHIVLLELIAIAIILKICLG